MQEQAFSREKQLLVLLWAPPHWSTYCRYILQHVLDTILVYQWWLYSTLLFVLQCCHIIAVWSGYSATKAGQQQKLNVCGVKSYRISIERDMPWPEMEQRFAGANRITCDQCPNLIMSTNHVNAQELTLTRGGRNQLGCPLASTFSKECIFPEVACGSVIQRFDRAGASSSGKGKLHQSAGKFLATLTSQNPVHNFLKILSFQNNLSFTLAGHAHYSAFPSSSEYQLCLWVLWWGNSYSALSCRDFRKVRGEGFNSFHLF